MSYTVHSSYTFNDTVLTPTGMAQLVDWESGHFQVVDLESATGTVALELIHPVAGGSYMLKIIQDSASALNVSWPATVKWPGGTTPTCTTTLDGYDIVSLLYDGTNYSATMVGDLK